MLPGETVATGASSACAECGKEMEIDVCSSAAGYFLGYMCGEHGVCVRETNYFPNKGTATKALEQFHDKGVLMRQRR